MHRAAEELARDGLLVKELAQRAVDDEDGKGEAAKPSERLQRHELRQRVCHPVGEARAVKSHEEEYEEGHEDARTHNHVAQGHGALCAKEEHRCHAGQRQRGVHGAHIRGRLPIGAVQHDQPASHHAQHHLNHCPHGVEAHGVEERQVHKLLRRQGAFQESPCPRVVAVSQLRQEPKEGEPNGRATELLLTLLGDDRQEIGHEHCGEGEGSEEPGGRVPNLCVQWEPSRGHRDRQERMPCRDDGPAVCVVREDKHRGEEQQDQEVQRPIAKYARHDEGRRGRRSDSVLGLLLADLTGRVCRHIAAQDKEGTNHNVDLRRQLVHEGRRARKRDEVATHDVEDQEEAHAVERVDALSLRSFGWPGSSGGLAHSGASGDAAVRTHCQQDRPCKNREHALRSRRIGRWRRRWRSLRWRSCAGVDRGQGPGLQGASGHESASGGRRQGKVPGGAAEARAPGQRGRGLRPEHHRASGPTVRWAIERCAKP
mmetsp:Transcript_93013/g.199483  ORF Transcript_93013/g.199483 Transcript_93013/m.199483 type:complete len:484 (+) Transcript_93013:241-1692(+)